MNDTFKNIKLNMPLIFTVVLFVIFVLVFVPVRSIDSNCVMENGFSTSREVNRFSIILGGFDAYNSRYNLIKQQNDAMTNGGLANLQICTQFNQSYKLYLL